MLKTNKAMGRINPRYHPSSTYTLHPENICRSLQIREASIVIIRLRYPCPCNGGPSVSAYKPKGNPVFS